MTSIGGQRATQVQILLPLLRDEPREGSLRVVDRRASVETVGGAAPDERGRQLRGVPICLPCARKRLPGVKAERELERGVEPPAVAAAVAECLLGRERPAVLASVSTVGAADAQVAAAVGGRP